MELPPPPRRKQFYAACVFVMLLACLLVVTKLQDGWDAGQWLVGGAIVLWALGPASAGGFLAARMYSGCPSLRRVRRATMTGSLLCAGLAALATVLIIQPETRVQYRPGTARFPLASDFGMIVSVQVFLGFFLGGMFAQYAAHRHSQRWGQTSEKEKPSR